MTRVKIVSMCHTCTRTHTHRAPVIMIVRIFDIQYTFNISDSAVEQQRVLKIKTDQNIAAKQDEDCSSFDLSIYSQTPGLISGQGQYPEEVHSHLKARYGSETLICDL